MAILILAANTAYADFTAAILGKDGYLPRQFAARGDRLVFSNGVLILAPSWHQSSSSSSKATSPN